MSQQNAVNSELAELKKKLDSAINSRLSLQRDLEVQSSTFVQFIIKLSQTAKGIDVLLDNRLAKLRKAFKKSLSWEDIEILLADISKLLKQHSAKNDQNIDNLHQQFEQAGLLLQQVKNLPPALRRELRTLINDNEDTKGSVLQYIAPLSQLLAFYQAALKAKESEPSKNINAHQVADANVSVAPTANKDVVERFSSFLTRLNVSTPYKLHINKIKNELSPTISHQDLLENFLEVFEIINKDLIQERNTAKAFLSTLCTTLSSVQTAVETTITSSEKAQTKHNQLNQKLRKDITEMAEGLNKANSLVDIKIDINEKLKGIVSSLEEKSSFELTQFKEMTMQLSQMKEKVNQLENQGKAFEKLIQEQQARSYQDALTKLGNRAAFDDYFAQKMVRFHNAPFELAIVVLDLERGQI